MCKAGYRWSDDPSLSNQCILDCSAVANSLQTNPTALTCACSLGFVFQESIGALFNVCARDCTAISFATSTNPTAPADCLCQLGYTWSTAFPKKCAVDCSADVHSTSQSSVNTCLC